MSLNSLLVTLIRHGESLDNQHGNWAGFRDTPLTNTGVAQARALGQAFANVSLTAIYSSDLRRAAMTAEEVLKANRSIPPPPLVQSKSLREQNFGQAEGQAYASTEWLRASTTPDARTFRFPDGESLEEVNARIAKAVRQFVLPRVEALRNGTSQGTHICIVAHGIAIAELLRVFISLHDDSGGSPWSDPNSTYKRVRLENTAWSRLELAVPVDLGHTAASAAFAESDLNIDASARPTSASRHVYVRLLCQNQTEHLRGTTLQPNGSNSATSVSHHLGGGGVDPISSPKPPSATASPVPAFRGLPASATLASIASSATSSTTTSTSATVPPASTPVSANRGLGPTPTTFRSYHTYDAKNMTRELEKAGVTTTLVGSEYPAGSTATSAAATAALDRLGASTPSTISTKLRAERNAYTTSPAPSGSYMSHSTAISSNPHAGYQVSSSDVWQTICVRVLPLFNGERLRTNIEELNETVSLHVRKTLERSHAKAIDTLTSDLVSLVSSGTLTLNSKLHGLDDSQHLLRLAEIWIFYLTHVLPYIEACFVPLQTDAVLHEVTSSSHQRVDVRKILLTGFRDEVVLPIYERLFYSFANIAELSRTLSISETDGKDDASKQVYFRLLQMTSVLASILSEDEAQVAIDGLLRALRMGSKGTSNGSRQETGNGPGMRTSSPAQRTSNRRGWMAQKAKKHGFNNISNDTIHGSDTSKTDARIVNRPIGAMAPPLSNFRTQDFGRYGAQLSEDEYLSSLRSPGSPAISTPGEQDPTSTPQARDHVWSTIHPLNDDSASPSTAPSLHTHLPAIVP